MALNRRGVHLPPTQQDVHGDTRRRVITAEQQLVKPDPTPKFCLTAGVTGYEGVYMRTALSSSWVPYSGTVMLDMVIVTLVDTASVDLMVSPLLNGETKDPVVVPAGEIQARTAYPGLKWSPTDSLSVHMDCEGGFPPRLLVELWFRGYGGGHLTFDYTGGV